MKILLALLASGLLVAGVLVYILTRSKPAEAPPEIFPFTNTTEVVTEKAIDRSEEGKSVEVDINLDGLQDLAVVEEVTDRGTEVSIYIQKKPEPSVDDGDDKDRVYYKAGTIWRSGPGKIIGIMTRRRATAPFFSDLLLLLIHEGQPNQILHYLNMGTHFVPVPSF